MQLFYLTLVLGLLLTYVNAASQFIVNDPDNYKQISRIGYGVQHLQQSHSKVFLPPGGEPTSCINVTQYWYTDAVIDNFAPMMTQQKWGGNGQRYMVNDQFWGGSSYPIFVYIEGEGELSCKSLTSRLFMFTLAQQHQALMVGVEHRFYGQSFPINNTDMQSLSYLSSTQALADLARIIGYIKSDFNTENSRIITIGGSYAGNLAAWFRLKYPSVTYASIASSAPMTAKANFSEYMDVVGQAMIYFSGQQCFDAFTLAAETVHNYTLQGFGSAGMTKLEQDFVTCSPITTQNDLGIFLSDLMGNVQGTVQYNNGHYGVMNVTDICQVMTATNDAYGNFVTLQKLYRESYNQTCEDASWNDTIAYLSETNIARCWVYQTCNEFGYYQTTDSAYQPFKSWNLLNLEFNLNMCYAAYDGWNVDPQVDWINQMYGDIQIDGSNIVFPAGTIDPWHALGVTNYTAPLPDDSERKVYILGTSHCMDLHAPASSDPQSLTNARQIIANQVSAWLSYGAPTMMPTSQPNDDAVQTTLVLAIVLPIAIVAIILMIGLFYWVYGRSSTAGTKMADEPVVNQMYSDRITELSSNAPASGKQLNNAV